MVVRNALAFTKVVKMPSKKHIPANPQTLGEHILRRRLQLRLLQRDVAERIDVTEESVMGWENGRSVPQIRLYPSIIAFLGYYPFEKDITNVSGQIEFIRYNFGLSYDRLGKELGVDSTTMRRWQDKKYVFKKNHRQRLDSLLQQCLSD
jgi:DNA-binding transcriptional regulator YiaG